MYEVVKEIIGVYPPDEFAFGICAILICVLTMVFIDLIYRLFRHFWR